ncbi:hypothetical protein L3X38_043092 [Prunus dulcis]|uniref:Uncharacterized protein n=1 Tax=Prunus dulcis TaxID=3755 RepID=A0AAD4UXH0_PRUDU|nr:hypothetical protein L3X38_043092 [Prunus dulcis]
MAVQAQYPSNILFLNRNSQEGHDYSLQAQPGGYLDQSHMLFNNGGGAVNNTINQRKRGRETSAATEISPSILPFSLQQQSQPPPPQLIDLSQLYSHYHDHNNPNVVSTGLRLSFGWLRVGQKPAKHKKTNNKKYEEENESRAVVCVL